MKKPSKSNNISIMQKLLKTKKDVEVSSYLLKAGCFDFQELHNISDLIFVMITSTMCRISSQSEDKGFSFLWI